MFRIGQKVCCVDDSPGQISGRKLLQTGRIYTVCCLRPLRTNGRPGVEVSGETGMVGSGWLQSRFRPLVTKKTNIDIFLRLLTEQEAREMECRPGGCVALARDMDGAFVEPVFAMCCASKCPAWRWGKSDWLPPEKPLKAVKEGNLTRAVPNDEKTEVKRGYCGLAGRPDQ